MRLVLEQLLQLESERGGQKESDFAKVTIQGEHELIHTELVLRSIH